MFVSFYLNHLTAVKQIYNYNLNSVSNYLNITFWTNSKPYVTHGNYLIQTSCDINQILRKYCAKGYNILKCNILSFN